MRLVDISVYENRISGLTAEYPATQKQLPKIVALWLGSGTQWTIPLPFKLKQLPKIVAK